MSRPTEPPEEFLRRENIMGVRKGVSAAPWTHLTPTPKCPDLLDTRPLRKRLFEEVVAVEVDQLGPGQDAHDAAQGQEDAERDGFLAPCGSLARDDEDA